MTKTISSNDAKLLAQDQVRNYASAVGSSATAPPDIIREAYEVAMTLQPRKFYLDHPNIRFIWELLDVEEHSSVFRATVDAWVEVEGNIQRAAQHVNRTIRSSTHVWSGFGVFRMKARGGGNWSLLDDHGRTDANEPRHDDPLPQTVVFIALTRLDHSNGFFMPLEVGQDVCIDSKAEIVYPPTGSGLGLAIWLRL
ncbi:hypothetical protein LTR78_009361 [Recurvomyces mirabilis]|uniref:Uncharacterized protein n=1 Tax=Recurvomyces mirabilis TaxID=574656 RepID=A0AAE0TPR1_9PEZI|nr:hypothetical protein LTR78_009361 [Recurvomyces mirabilis]